MLNDARMAEIAEFLDGVSRLSVDDFARVRKKVLDDHPIRKPARGLMKLGAADFSHLDKRVGDLLVPMIPLAVVSESEAFTVHLGSTIGDVMGAVQAIVKRDKLSVEQYEAFVGGFREAGVAVPDHPSLSEDR